MYYIKDGLFIEDSYDMNKEALSASLFTTGNGYMGVRGSFEEFGSLRIQGAFVRGFIDDIIEVCEPFANNEYMKKYYLDEEKLKTFERQDSCVNMHDFLIIQIIIGEEIFYPWNGKIIKFERVLNPYNGLYSRNIIWESDNGLQTEFIFERFASFNSDHLYCQKVTITPLNHQEQVKIVSGIDTIRKTGGQIITQTDSFNVSGSNINHRFHAKNKYMFSATYDVYNNFPDGSLEEYNVNGVRGILCNCNNAKTYSIEKFTFVITSRDPDLPLNYHYDSLSFENEFNLHYQEYKKLFDIMNVEISGDNEADGYLRYANYQTLISASRHDSIHGISAKSLSGERYNQFVWWDQEIHQLPFFFATNPIVAKNALLYRYRMLKASKDNAILSGEKGAKYAFCSSVNGDERVWQYARHPFLQVHINSDIPQGIINYYDWTMDNEFMRSFGLEIIHECLKYWENRLTKTKRGYELLNVTGTDEHHPYVNNDAYTNYSVKYIFERFIKLCNKFDYNVELEEINRFIDISEHVYLPVLNNGLIPQFDGYFELSKTLVSSGGPTLKQFQMKSGGQYQYSQIIKQPDVALLYTFTNIDMDLKHYGVNWDYYEKMCETSSSLTFPVHAVASADNGRMMSFYNYFMNTLKIDIDDIHGVGWQGLHAGCLAGGYYAILRGIFGVKAKEEYLVIKPVEMPLFDSIKIRFYYHGVLLELELKNNNYTIKILNNKEVSILINNNIELIKTERKFSI